MFTRMGFDYIVDPCCGDRQILDTLEVPLEQRIENDIDVEWKAPYQMDATQAEFWDRHVQGLMGRRLCITNPPFNQAFEVLQHAYATCDLVVMLLRLTFLEPTNKRGDWLAKHPPNQIFVTPRVSFTGTGKDTTTTIWAVWGHTYLPSKPIQVLNKSTVLAHRP